MVRLQLLPAPPAFASWCNSSMPGFDPEGLGANPSEAANSQPVSSKSERQSYKLRTLENYQHGLPILPLSVEVCTPVSETGRAGALPEAAANFQSHCASTNKEQTPGNFYERHTE